MADKEHDPALIDEEDRQRPSAKEQDEARKASLPPDDDPKKDNLLEYFGADGEDEGQKLMQNADGSWGDPGAAG